MQQKPFKQMAEAIKKKLDPQDILDINGDGTINELDTKEYISIFAKTQSIIIGTYATITGIQDPTQINPQIIILLAIIGMIIAIIIATITKAFKKQKSKTEIAIKTFIEAQKNQEEKEQTLKQIIENQKKEINEIKEKLNLEKIYREFQEKIAKELYTIQNIDNQTLQKIIQYILNPNNK